MNLKNIISISPSVLENILYEEVKKIPGISEDHIKQIKLNDKEASIDVYIKPFSLIGNLYDLASEIQHAISFYLTSQFDLKEGQIMVNVYVMNPDEGENK